MFRWICIRLELDCGGIVAVLLAHRVDDKKFLEPLGPLPERDQVGLAPGEGRIGARASRLVGAGIDLIEKRLIGPLFWRVNQDKSIETQLSN